MDVSTGRLYELREGFDPPLGSTISPEQIAAYVAPVRPKGPIVAVSAEAAQTIRLGERERERRRRRRRAAKASRRRNR